MASNPRRNPNVPAIPVPTPGAGLFPAVRALKDGVESLSGQRGSILDRAVTFNDLVRMGLATEPSVSSSTGSTTVVGSTSTSRDYVTPEDYGAIGDGTSRPASTYLGVATLAELQAYRGGMYSFAESVDDELDWLGLQAALYRGGLVLGRHGARYVCNKMVFIRNGYAAFDGRGCDWLFTNQVAIPDDGSNLLTNPSFEDGATGWQNTNLTPRVDVVFSGGKATFTDPPVSYGPDETHFGQFGQQVTMPPGRWTVRARVTTSEGASEGRRGNRVLGMGFSKDAPGEGQWEWPDPLYWVTAAGIDVGGDYDGWISFDVEIPETITPWLTFTGFNCDWEVHEARISPFLENYAVFCNGDYSSETAYFDSTANLRNVLITGPATTWLGAYAGAEIDAVLNKGFFDDGRCNFDNVHIRRFRRGMVYGTNAYLISHTATTIGECFETLYFASGSTNAGENLRYNNCIFFNSDLFLNAEGGAEWNFFGCSTDYCERQVRLRQGAVANFHGHHWEYRPSDTDYLFDLDDGSTFVMTSGELLQAGFEGGAFAHATRLNTQLDTMRFGDVWGYNWRTASGEWATGAGTVSFSQHIGPGNALLPNLMLRNGNMDVFGGSGRIAGPGTASDMGFDPPTDGVGLICALHMDSPPSDRLLTPNEGGVYLDTVDPPETGYSSLWVEYDGSTGYVDNTAAFRLFVPVSQGKVVLFEHQWRNPNTYSNVTHGPFTNGVPSAGDTISVTTYEGSGLIMIEDKHCATLSDFGPQKGWTVSLSGVSGNPGGVPDATLNTTHTIVERLGADTYTIEVGVDATSSVTGAGGAAIGATYTQTNWLLFFRAFWVNVVRYDAVGRPVIGQAGYQGEKNILVPNTANSWTTANFGTWYAEPGTPDTQMELIARGRAPAWASHLMLIWDFYNIKHITPGAKGSFRLGHFFANVL